MFEEVGNFVIDSTGETMSIVRTKGGVSIMPRKNFKWAWAQYNLDKWYDFDKLKTYLKNGKITEFNSDEECRKWFNEHRHKDFKTVKELKRYQGIYGFSVCGKYYHINSYSALDVKKNPFNRKQNRRENNRKKVA